MARKNPGIAKPTAQESPMLPTWIARVQHHPLLAGLSPEELRLALRDAELQTLPTGQTLLRQDSNDFGLFLLLSGDVAVQAGPDAAERLVTLIHAPAVLGLLALVDGNTRSASLVTLGPVEVMHMPRATFALVRQQSAAFGNAVTQYLAGELRRMYALETAMMGHFDDFFEAPNAKLVPGPYVAKHVDMWMLVMRAKPELLASLLPPGLRPLPGFGDRFLLTFNAFSGVHSEAPVARGKSFAYHETCPFIPCLGPRMLPVMFTPELYPDNLLAIALGREAYGFPKRFGRTNLHPNAVDLTVGNRLILRAHWQAETPSDPGVWGAHLAAVMSGRNVVPPWLQPVVGALVQASQSQALHSLQPSVPVFVRKQIVDESTVHERVWDVDELIEIPFEVRQLSGFATLQAPVVEYLDPGYFLQGQCEGGVRLAMSFRFGRGVSWRDYKSEAERDNSWRPWRPKGR